MKTITRGKLDEVMRAAVSAACEELDGEFPGYEAGGITSSFARSLEKHIEGLLTKSENPLAVVVEVPDFDPVVLAIAEMPQADFDAGISALRSKR